MLNRKLLPIVSLLGLGFLPAVQADDQVTDDRWYIAPYGTFLLTDQDRLGRDGWGGGMSIGKMLDRHFNLEIKGFYQGFNAQYGKWSMTGGTADLQYYFFRDTFSPYTVIGAGGMNSCVGGNCAAGFIGEAGLGFTYELHENLLFRSDLRYRYNNNIDTHVQPGTTDFNDMVVNAGFEIPFGAKPRSAPVKFDPTPAPKPVTPPPADCSTMDSDHDGVNNCVDKCSDTPKGAKVDKYGCPLKLILKGSHFRVDSHVLTPEAKVILDEVASSLIAYPEKNDIEVQGYTSSEGGDAHNMKLSQNRAKSVVEYLKSKGVTNKLSSKGFGKAHPVADNRTEAGRSENRRVELIWVQN
jgi:OmpA-OmpF porin, OOP family